MLGAGGLAGGSVHIKGGIEVNVIAKGWPAKLQAQHLHRSWAIRQTVWLLRITVATASQALEMDQLQGPGAHTWFRAVLQGNPNLSRKKISPWLGPSHSGSLEDVQGSKQKPTENPIYK